MPAAPPPANEAERLAALRSFAVLDTAAERAFDELVALGARLTGCPVALVSLVDADRQWFKANHGPLAAVRETPREHAFCAHAILDPGGRPLVVPDARADPRFADNPLVAGGPGVRAYLGVPLVDAEGHALGTFCAIDTAGPRVHTPEQVAAAEAVARAVMAALELRRALRRAEEASLTDPLTGLPNRPAAARALDALFAGAAGAGGRGGGAGGGAGGAPPALAVLAVDLDHFKEANDAHGHDAGDALLRAAAARLRARVRPGDVVARVGGDEFLCLLPGLADRAAAAAVADRVAAALAEPVAHGGATLRLGATVGFALCPDDAAEPGLLLRLADGAMLAAKRAGRRGRVGAPDPGAAAKAERAAAVARAVAEAVAAGDEGRDGPVAHLQPILDLRTGRPAAAEALARWRHPALGDVGPAEMFGAAPGPAAEAALSRRVRRAALAAHAALRRDGLAPPRVAVNLSAAELLREDAAEAVEEDLAAAGLAPSALVVEVAEDAIVERASPRAVERLARLRGRGALVALDDFGAGASGLGRLLRLPLDWVKLDKAFARGLGTDERAERLVEGAAKLAHALGFLVVLEGVETAAQARLARDLGCDLGQGWHWAPALDPADGAGPGGLRGWLRQAAAAAPAASLAGAGGAEEAAAAPPLPANEAA